MSVRGKECVQKTFFARNQPCCRKGIVVLHWKGVNDEMQVLKTVLYPLYVAAAVKVLTNVLSFFFS